MKTPLLSSREMRGLGFTDPLTETWHFVQRVGRNVSFNLTIIKATGEYETEVLNEFFLQPELYGEMSDPYRTAIKASIDVIVSDLNGAGLTITHDHTEYGYEEES